MFLLMCALIAGGATLRVWASEDLFLSIDNDSTMRLVQVRDLLAGQGWFDLVQHRLGFGSGVEMHWSRLIDGPLVALITLFGLVTDSLTAQWATLILWPSFWLGVAFWTTLTISLRVGGRFAAPPAFFACAMVLLTLVWYIPGSIDHHNVQLALLLISVWALLGRHDGLWRAPVAALCVASSLVIGVELLPHLTVLCLWFAGKWISRGEQERRPMTAFGVTLAASLLGLFALTAPASAYVGGYCDAISADILLPVLGTTLLLTGGAALLSGNRWPSRLVFGVVGGAAVLGASVATFPACLANPLDRLDPLLVTHWLDHVDEAQSIFGILQGEQGVFYGFSYLLAGFAVLIYVGLLRHSERRDETGLLLVLTVAAFGMACYQVRYVAVMTTLSIPALAWWAGSLRKASMERQNVLSVLAAALALLLLVPHVWAVFFVLLEPTPIADASGRSGGGEGEAHVSHMACFLDGDFRKIASLPPGRVAATSNLGSQIVLQSSHSVIAAPYHRNQAGMLAEIKMALTTDGERLEEQLHENDIDYLVVCKDDPETFLRDENAEGEPILLRVATGEVTLTGYPLLMTLGGVYVFGAATASE